MEATKTTCHHVVSAEIHAGAVPMAYRSATKKRHSDSFGNVLPCGLHWKHQNERHIRHSVSNIRIHEDIWGYMGIQYGKDEDEDTWNAGTTHKPASLRQPAAMIRWWRKPSASSVQKARSLDTRICCLALRSSDRFKLSPPLFVRENLKR